MRVILEDFMVKFEYGLSLVKNKVTGAENRTNLVNTSGYSFVPTILEIG
jgi:hypothetical protein